MPNDYAVWVGEERQRPLQATVSDEAPGTNDIGPEINNHADTLLANVLDLLGGFFNDLACSLDRFLGLSCRHIDLSFGRKFLTARQIADGLLCMALCLVNFACHFLAFL